MDIVDWFLKIVNMDVKNGGRIHTAGEKENFQALMSAGGDRNPWSVFRITPAAKIRGPERKNVDLIIDEPRYLLYNWEDV